MPDRVHLSNAPTYRNFDETPDPDEPGEGPVFELGGETFHCVPVPPGDTFFRLHRAAVNAKGQPLAVSNPDVLLFIEQVICEEMLVDQPTPTNGDTPEGEPEAEPGPVAQVWEKVDDLDRWHTLLSRKRNPVHAEKLGEVVLWLIEWYTGRPTTPSRR